MLKNRIKEIRAIKNLTQEEFGERIDVSGALIGMYEKGIRNPPERTRKDICNEFHINREWLEEGKGPRDKEMTEKEKLIARIDEVYNGPDDFHKQALHVLAEMRPEEIKILQIMADKIIEKRQK